MCEKNRMLATTTDEQTAGALCRITLYVLLGCFQLGSSKEWHFFKPLDKFKTIQSRKSTTQHVKCMGTILVHFHSIYSL